MGRNIEDVTPLPYNGSKQYQKIIRKNAALQLVKLISKFSSFEKNEIERLRHGTETEVHVLIPKKINNMKIYTVSGNVRELVKKLREKHNDNLRIEYEYASWMIELIPKETFKSFLDISEIYRHFKYIADKINDGNNSVNDEVVLAGISTLPHLGTLNYYIDDSGFSVPMKKRSKINSISHSKSYLDYTIADNIRYINFTKNLMQRKGSKPFINLPIYQDAYTRIKNYKLDHYGYGGACCGLQCTFSTKNLTECRFLYDQLNVLSFLFQCLSNSSGIINGKLSAWDGRWYLPEFLMDDRTPNERKNIEKGRFSSIQFYISNDKRNKHLYNDRKYTLNKKFRKNLKHLLKEQHNDFYKDTRLLNHYAYLFVREALLINKEDVEKDRSHVTNDFDIIQSTNWNNVRIKPPSSFGSNDGWLLEFRSMDVPITAREKAALIFLVKLFVRIILDDKLKVSFYIPISKADQNFHNALLLNADLNQKFYFRKYFCEYLHGKKIYKDDMVQLNLLELFEGNEEFDGLKILIEAFINVNKAVIIKESNEHNYSIEEIIWDVYNFYVARCRGDLMNNARFFRHIVRTHPEYKFDSIIPDNIITALFDKVWEVQTEDYNDKLFGNFLMNMDKTFK